MPKPHTPLVERLFVRLAWMQRRQVLLGSAANRLWGAPRHAKRRERVLQGRTLRLLVLTLGYLRRQPLAKIEPRRRRPLPDPQAIVQALTDLGAPYLPGEDLTEARRVASWMAGASLSAESHAERAYAIRCTCVGGSRETCAAIVADAPCLLGA